MKGKLISIEKGEDIPNDIIPPPPGLTPLHVAGFEGNVTMAVGARSPRVRTGACRLSRHVRQHGHPLYAAARGNSAFIEVCTTEFGADVLIPNNANELVLEVANSGKVSLSRDEAARKPAREA